MTSVRVPVDGRRTHRPAYRRPVGRREIDASDQESRPQGRAQDVGRDGVEPELGPAEHRLWCIPLATRPRDVQEPLVGRAVHGSSAEYGCAVLLHSHLYPGFPGHLTNVGEDGLVRVAPDLLRKTDADIAVDATRPAWQASADNPHHDGTRLALQSVDPWRRSRRILGRDQ